MKIHKQMNKTNKIILNSTQRSYKYVSYLLFYYGGIY